MESAIWSRQPCDNEDSWKAFVLYRDQRAPRRLSKVFGFPSAKVAEWFRTNCWADRVAAYDRHMDEILVAEREEALKTETKAITAGHMAILADARELAEKEMSKFLADSQASDRSGLKFSDLVKLVDLVVKLDRLLQDKPGEITDDRSIDFSQFTTEELETLKRLGDKGRGKS